MPDARWLDAEAAAEYISVRVDALPRLVKQGRIPAPDHRLGTRSPRWDRLALDAAFDGGTASVNIDKAVASLVEKMGSEGRARRPVHARGWNNQGVSVSVLRHPETPGKIRGE